MIWGLETREALEFTRGGRIHKIPASSRVPDAELLYALATPVNFARWARAPRGTPLGVVEDLRRAYCVSQGIPEDYADVQHLVAILDRFGSEIEIDLQRQDRIDGRQLWQRREWRRLRNHIDHLPQATFYHEAILNDDEIVKSILEREAKEKDKKKREPGIPVSENTTEVATMRDLINAVNSLKATLVAVNSKNGRMPDVKPYPGPLTAVERAKRAMRKADHDHLVSVFLPHEGGSGETVE